MDRFLVWSVDSMTEWSLRPMCYALSEQGGQCHIDLPLLVYSEFAALPPPSTRSSVESFLQRLTRDDAFLQSLRTPCPSAWRTTRGP